MGEWKLVWVPGDEELPEEGKEFLSKLALLPPHRTEPIAGQISDITFTPVGALEPSIPIIPANAANNTIIGTLAAVDAVGTVSFNLFSRQPVGGHPGPEVPVSPVSQVGDLIKFSPFLDPDLPTPDTLYTFVIDAEDVRGPSRAFRKNISFQTYAIPTAIALGSPGTILETAPSGTIVGPLNASVASGGPIALPLTFSVVSPATFTTASGSGGTNLVRSSSGSLSGPSTATVTVRVTDLYGETFDQDIDVSVLDVPEPTGDTRFDAVPIADAKIGIIWNLAGQQPTDAPTITTLPNAQVSTGTWCTEGSVGTWKIYSTDCPLIHNLTAISRDDVRKKAILAGYTSGSIRPGTLANPLDYDGPYWLSTLPITQDDTATEHWSFEGTGVYDGGTGPSGVALRGLPKCQFKPRFAGADADGFFDLRKGVNCESIYRVHQIRNGPFREEEEAFVYIAFNVQGATTVEECTGYRRLQNVAGAGYGEVFKKITYTECEIAGSFSDGFHTQPGGNRSNKLRQTAIVNFFDCKAYNNGGGGLDHNVYIGGLRHAVFGYNYFTFPGAHNWKFDNQQRWDLYENCGAHYDASRSYVGRTLNAKVFRVEGTTYEPAKRVVQPDGTVTIYSWISDTDDVTNPAVPVVLKPYMDVTEDPARTEFTVKTSGTPDTAMEVVRVITGNPINDKKKNNGVATFTFHPSKIGHTVRIPGKGWGIIRDDGGGVQINCDNPNQDGAAWNNMFHPLFKSGTARGVLQKQGRHGYMDFGCLKMPSFSRNAPDFEKFQDLEFVLGGVDPATGYTLAPKSFTGYIGTPVPISPGVYQLMGVEYPYPDVAGPGAGSAPNFVPGSTVYDIDIRCDDAYVHTTTCTITSKTNANRREYSILLATDIPAGHPITGNADHRNAVVMKLQSIATWDRPRLDHEAQRPFFDRTHPHYYPYEVTQVISGSGTTAVRKNDLDKSEPDGVTNIYGLPLIHLRQNLTIPLIGSSSLGSAGIDKGALTRVTNQYFMTKHCQQNDGNLYRLGIPFPPLQPSDGVAWAIDPDAGVWDCRVHGTTTLGGPCYGTHGRNGFGVNGSDFIRWDATIVEENCLYDPHMPAGGKFEQMSAPGNTEDDTVYHSGSLLGDIRAVPQDTTTTVDHNGCVPFTVAHQGTFPSFVDKGSPFKVIGKYGATGGTYAIYAGGINGTRTDGCRIQTQAGGTPLVGYLIALECDGQHQNGDDGRGTAAHHAYLTSVTTINATTFDVLFDPPLPSIGDADPWFSGDTVTEGHEKGLSVFDSTDLDRWGGRGCFAKPSRYAGGVQPTWRKDPVTEIADAYDF